MPDAFHLLHPEQPYLRSQEETEAYLKATFPKSAEIIRVGINEKQHFNFVGVGGAFGCGVTWDAAVAHLMRDEMIHAYVEP